MAVRHENECVGCPPEMGCLGSCCPNRNVIRLYCDKCKTEVEHLYWSDGEQLCQDCIMEQYEEVDV